MSSDDTAISVRDVSKHYLLFAKPEDRLKQSIMPRLQRLVRRRPKQYYRDFAALHRVSFDVKRGETVGIIGRNGCGKSTLLQIVCGILQPNSGTVSVNGRIAALLELGSGFNRDFSGRENVYMNGAILGLSRAEIDARFEAIARFADIGDFLEQPVKTYSSGMQVRLAFATAINVDPDILVVDEALAVGDEAFKRKCYARLEEIQNKGGTILFVSHSAQAIVQLCSRAMLIDRGEILLQGAPKTVTNQYQRLIHASAESAKDIIASIVELRETLSTPQRPLPPKLASRQAAARSGSELASYGMNGTATSPEPRAAARLVDYYDPGLTSKSVVCLEERGARIRDVRITTLDGIEVNVLQMGKRYVFEFYVDVSVEAKNVGFGMWFRTTTGVGLGGGQTIFSKAHRTPHIKANSVAHVRYEFTNILLPGVYFLSCGLSGTPCHETEQIVMHRIIDKVALRVPPEPDLVSTGIVDFAPKAIITMHNSTEATGEQGSDQCGLVSA